MKSAEKSTGTSKRPQGDAAPSSRAMLATEETFVDLIATVDSTGGVEDVDPTAPLSLRAMMQSIMTTQAAHG